MDLGVDRWVGRYTSMRGRLALLLIGGLVLPLLALGTWDYRVQSRAERDAETPDSDSVAIGNAKLRASDSAQLLSDVLDATLAHFALDASRLSSVDQADLDAVFGSYPEGSRPTLAVELAPGADDLSMLPASLGAALRKAWATRRRDEPLRGYVEMPDETEGGERHVFEVAVVPKASGRPGLTALRSFGSLVLARDVEDLGRGEAALDSLAFGGVVKRALILSDGTIALLREGSSARGRSREEDLIGMLAAGHREAWAVALMDADGPGNGETQKTGLHGAASAVPILGLDGQPAALLAVEAEVETGVVLALGELGSPAVVLRQALLRLALLGVALAIGIGLLAPRFLWRDIRRSTDFIFHSVERLRELVRRISLALDEQGRVIRDLSQSVSALEGASSSIAETSKSLAHSAEQSAWVSQSGNLKAEMAQRAVVDMRDSVAAIREQMTELDRRAAEIGAKLQAIADLSSETNKVSINASIQLRGAGSGGQHFGEFVEEIRALADQALDCTRDIRQVVGEIQESSRTTVEATDRGVQDVDRCQSAFEELETSFTRILRWVEDTTQSAQGIQRSTHAQSDSLQVVARAISSLEARELETAGHFDAVVDATEELAGLGQQMNETWRVG